MRRIGSLIAATVLLIGLGACQPAPTITATPSTLTPGCETVTTVEVVTTPKNAIKNIVLEYQRSNGVWETWRWFDDLDGGDTWRELRWSIPESGTRTVTYARPQPGTKTMRLRMRGMKKLSDAGWVSKSWYITPTC